MKKAGIAGFVVVIVEMLSLTSRKTYFAAMPYPADNALLPLSEKKVALALESLLRGLGFCLMWMIGIRWQQGHGTGVSKAILSVAEDNQGLYSIVWL